MKARFSDETSLRATAKSTRRNTVVMLVKTLPAPELAMLRGGVVLCSQEMDKNGLSPRRNWHELRLAFDEIQ